MSPPVLLVRLARPVRQVRPDRKASRVISAILVLRTNKAHPPARRGSVTSLPTWQVGVALEAQLLGHSAACRTRLQDGFRPGRSSRPWARVHGTLMPTLLDPVDLQVALALSVLQVFRDKAVSRQTRRRAIRGPHKSRLRSDPPLTKSLGPQRSRPTRSLPNPRSWARHRSSRRKGLRHRRRSSRSPQRRKSRRQPHLWPTTALLLGNRPKPSRQDPRAIVPPKSSLRCLYQLPSPPRLPSNLKPRRTSRLLNRAARPPPLLRYEMRRKLQKRPSPSPWRSWTRQPPSHTRKVLWIA